MKIFRNILLGVLVFLFLLCSCSGGTDPEGSASQEKEGIEKEAENPYEDEDETEEDETGDIEIGNIEAISEKVPSAPVFLYCRTVAENEIVFGFSQAVSLISLDLKPDLKFEKIKEGSEVKIKLTEKLDPGLPVKADLLAKDGYGNTVREQLNFRTRNDRVPKMQINELRTEYSKPKAEFIEFKMLSDGNLGALRVFVAGNNKNPLLYEFAPVEVNKYEYVVLHLRTLDESCQDEDGENLNKSGGTDSSPTGRDFWISGSTKLLHKTDAVYVLDQDNRVLDAVMISEKSDPLWDKEYFTEAAKFLYDQDAWKSPAGKFCSPADAVISFATTLTRSICRDENVENTHTAADWYITVNSGVTPGKENNTKRYN
jgi:hypothetical protein